MKLHAANLSPLVTEQKLRGIFEKYGRVLNVELHLRQLFGRTFGDAYVEMNSQEGLSAARTLNGRRFLKRRMYIDVCR